MFGKNESLYKHAAGIGIFVVVLYALCLLWRMTMSEPEVIRFHLLALKTAFPGFSGLEVASVLWGAVLSFIYGFLGSVIFHSLHKNCCGIK